MITDQDYGLQRIILIDSFLPGRSYIVDVSGNTGIIGDNGSGKTSFIKLPVIFYGERPIKIGIRQNIELKLKGFSGWYLPHDGSYVVYEYLSEGEKRCAVFMPDNNTEEGICRYFIESGYEHSLFYDEAVDRPCSKEQLLKNLTLQNIRYHSPHSFELYRKILLDGDVKGQKHFSMVPTGSKLSQLHELFGGMLNRETDFSTLCTIIENWAHKGIGDDSRNALSSFTLDRSKLKNWIVEYDAQNKLQKRATKEVIKEAKGSFEAYKYSCTKISKIVDRAEAWKDTLVLDLEDLRKANDEKNLEIQKKLATNTADLKEVNNKIYLVEQKTSSFKAELTNLDTQKSNYEKKIGDDYQSRLNELAHCRKQLEFCNGKKNALTDEAAQIASWYKDQKQDLLKRFDDDKVTYQSQIIVLNSDKKDVDHARSLQLIHDINENKDKVNQKKAILDKDLQNIHGELIKLNALSINPKCPQELTERKEILIQQRDDLSEQMGLLNDERDLKSRNKIKKDSIYQELNKVIERLDKERDDIELEIESVNAKLNANEKSLLTFVKNNVPDWKNTFGKIVRNDVLLKTNLKPYLSIVESDIDTLYGVNIETESLPSTEDFDQDSLEDERKNLLIELQKVETDFKHTENKLKETLLEAEKATKSLEKNETQISMLKPKVHDNRNQLNRIENEIISWLDQYRVKAQVEVDKKIASVDIIKNNLSDLDELLINEKTNIEELSNQNKFSAETVFLTAKTAIQKDIDQLIEKEASTLLSLEETYHAKLNDKGVNPELLNKLDLEIQLNKDKVQKLTKLQQLVLAYQDFIKDDYSKYAGLEKDFKVHSDNLKKISDIKADLKSTHDTLIDEQSETRSAYTANNTQIQSDITTLKALLRDNSQSPVMVSDDVIVTIDDVKFAFQLKLMYDEAIKTRDNNETITLDLLRPIKSVFTDERNQGTSLHLYFSNNPTNTNTLIGLAKLIFNYIDNDLQKNDIRILRNNLNDLDKLNNYVSYINTFGNKIAEFSRSLDQHMEQISSFDSLENLRATIYFSLIDEQSWKDMKALSDSYKGWRDQESGSYELGELKADLPSQVLFDSIQDYVENASTQELSTNDLAKFIDFRIEFEDQGTLRRVKSHKFLKQASSNARSYLILVVIFIGFVNMVRGKHRTPLVWAVDELRDISVNNIEKLVDLLGANNISLISACPDLDEHIYEIFDKIYEIYKLDDGSTVFAQNLPDVDALEFDSEEV